MLYGHASISVTIGRLLVMSLFIGSFQDHPTSPLLLFNLGVSAFFSFSLYLRSVTLSLSFSLIIPFFSYFFKSSRRCHYDSVWYSWPSVTFNNQATCQFYIYVLDIIPPILSCPASIVVPAVQGTGQYPYDNLTLYRVQDNMDNVTVVTSFSGSHLDIGTTNVTLIAYDASYNMAECSILVTVNDTQPPTFTTCPKVRGVCVCVCGVLYIGENKCLWTICSVWGNVFFLSFFWIDVRDRLDF